METLDGSSVCWLLSVTISDPQLHLRSESAWRGEGLQASVYRKEPRVFMTKKKKKVIVSFLWMVWLFWHTEMFTKGQTHSSRSGGGGARRCLSATGSIFSTVWPHPGCWRGCVPMCLGLRRRPRAAAVGQVNVMLQHRIVEMLREIRDY